MGYSPVKSFNTTIKIAGDTVTYKSYENEQVFGYQTKTSSLGEEIKKREDIGLEGYNEHYKVDMKTGEILGQVTDEYMREKIEEGKILKEQEEQAIKEQKEEQKKERFIKSCFRAKTAIYDLVACNVNKHVDHEGKKQRVKFLTLTFKDNIQEIETANREIPTFLKRVCYHLWGIKTNKLKYIAVPELQERGAWHFHIIVFNMPYVKHEELLQLWGLGGVYVNAINTCDSGAVAQYVTKYISKGIRVEEGKEESEINQSEENEGEKNLSNYENYKKHNMQDKKRYYVSRGLYRPIVYRLNLSEEEKKAIEHVLENNTKAYMKEGKLIKNSYKGAYDNEYRGKINLLRVRTSLDIKALKNDFRAFEKMYINQHCINLIPNWKEVKKERRKRAIQACRDIEEKTLLEQYYIYEDMGA